MLVRDVIKAMESQELTGKKLAEQYGVSPRTISKKISGLGYKYDNTGKTYSFVGDDLEAVESLEFSSLFDPAKAVPGTVKKATAVTAKPTARKNVTTRKAVTAKPKAVKGTTPAVSPEKPLDSIDRLLLASEKPERTYRGYYFDADILAVIDRAGNKSALINEALRRVFTEKGLL